MQVSRNGCDDCHTRVNVIRCLFATTENLGTSDQYDVLIARAASLTEIEVLHG